MEGGHPHRVEPLAPRFAAQDGSRGPEDVGDAGNLRDPGQIAPRGDNLAQPAGTTLPYRCRRCGLDQPAHRRLIGPRRDSDQDSRAPPKSLLLIPCEHRGNHERSLGRRILREPHEKRLDLAPVDRGRRDAKRDQQKARPAAPGEKLQKMLAGAGLGSRRDMDALIAAGDVSVNGKVAQVDNG